MEVIACIGVLALSGHVGFANLGIAFALFAFAASLSLSLAFPSAF